MVLFHITTREEWTRAAALGTYRAGSLDTEGFIHLSLERQWVATANRFFRNGKDLVLLRIAGERLAAPVKFEDADGDAFPHLYGALNVDAVEAVLNLVAGPDGVFGDA